MRVLWPQSTYVQCFTVTMTRDDKNVQVFLAALILMDDTLVQLEATELPQNKISALLSRVLSILLKKLSDSTQKVVEGSTLALLSAASSPSVDIDILAKAATKRIRSKDANSRTLRARLTFLENIVAEFKEDVNWKPILRLLLGQKAFDHKDGGVRDAAKSLVISLMMVSLLFACSLSPHMFLRSLHLH